MKNSGIGGQAVIEGVMMRGPSQVCVAVRKPDGTIETETNDYISYKEKYKVSKIPIVRGIFSFVESLASGMGALNHSAAIWDEEEEKQEKQAELKTESQNQEDNETSNESNESNESNDTSKDGNNKKAGISSKKDDIIMGLVIVVSIVIAIGLFVLLPFFISENSDIQLSRTR